MLKERDIRQRTLGFISFSFLAHLGLIAATFLLPNVLKEVKPGSSLSETYLVESSTPVSLGESAQAEPQQVLTAPVDDSSAIVVAKNELPKANTELPVQQQVPQKKVVTPAREKAETATKKVLALPSKKALPAKAAQKVETVDQSELEVSQALKNARETEQEALPEVAADIEVPEVAEQAPQQEEQQVQESETEAAPVESATTTSGEETSKDAELVVVPPAELVESAQPAASAPASPAPQPLIAPIQRGAQLTRPSGQVGGLGTAGATEAATGSAAGAAGGIRDADSLMEQPGNAKPNYADDDQRAGRQGVVVFDAVVTREGTVQAIQMKQSSGFSSLDSSAYEAFKKHRYLPGQEGAVRKKFQFVLNGEKTVPGRLRRR